MKVIGLIGCGIGIILVLTAAHSTVWRSGQTFPYDFRVGLLTVHVYDQVEKEEYVFPPSQLGPRGHISPGDHYVAFSTATYALSFGAAVLLLVAGAAFWRWDSKPMAKAAAVCCVLLLGTTIAALATWKGSSTLSLNWPPWLSLLGSAAGLAGTIQIIRPTVTRSSFLRGGEMLRRTFPSFRRSGRASGGLIYLGGKTGQQEKGVESDASSPEVASVIDFVRFVALDCAVSEAGVRAAFADGHVSRTAWEQVASVVVRRLPLDEPYGGQIMVDILSTASREGDQPPVRLMTATKIRGVDDVKSAGDTAAMLRLAVRHILHESPNVSAGLDVMHFTQGKEPANFSSVQEFEMYDSRFA
jgi:hypothetical protein